MALESLVKQLSNFAAPGGTSVQVKTGYLEAASQSYKAGAPLISSSGRLAIAAEDVTTNIIVGFANKDASGITSNPTAIMPAFPMLEFEATLEDGTTGDYALTLANLFVKYGLAVTSGGLWYLDQVETTNVAAVVVALVDPVGTVQGRVRARLLNKVALGGV